MRILLAVVILVAIFAVAHTMTISRLAEVEQAMTVNIFDSLVGMSERCENLVVKKDGETVAIFSPQGCSQ